MTDADQLKEITERFRFANEEWREIREQGDIDMRYVAGDPWEPADRRAREEAHRPCLSEDELSQYSNQAINQVRQNPRAAKFTPQGAGANDTSAQFYADKAREIEYRSHAQLAYITAFENTIHRSFGWVRMVSKFASESVEVADPSAFYQELWIQDIPNPNQVVPDPAALRPDSSDMNYLFYIEQHGTDEFTRRWPGASVTNFSNELFSRLQAEDWYKGGRVQVAEYWKKEVSGSRTLLQLKPPVGASQPFHVFEDALATRPSSEQILNERKIDRVRVTQYLTNGVEILETNRWPGKHIPFVSCLGKVIFVDDGTGAKRHILSLTRLQRSPQMLYAYYCTTEAEIVGAIPKFPYFVYEGQLAPDEGERLAKSLHEPIAYITVKPTSPTSGAAILPPPTRQPWDPPLQGIQLGKESARRAIQAAAGIMPLPTSAQRKNEKSGVALQEIEKSEQVGSFHFSQHYDDMIRQLWVIGEDLMDKIHDTPRQTAVRDAKGKTSMPWINTPTIQPPQETPIYTKGDHAVAVSSGPAEDTLQESIADFVGSLMSIPEVAAKAADVIIRIQGTTMISGGLSPLMEDLADRLTPPEFRKPKDGQGPDPQQLQQQAAQLQQENAQLKDAVSKVAIELKTRQHEIASNEKIATAKLFSEAQIEFSKQQFQLRLQAMKDATSIADARITAAKASFDQGAEAREEALALIQQQHHEAQQAELDRAHERGMAQLAQQHALEQGQQDAAASRQQSAQDHGEALDQGAQSHQQALEQTDQQQQGDQALAAQQAEAQPPAGGAA